jgi:two-component system phosphate regulon response regulator PhoB
MIKSKVLIASEDEGTVALLSRNLEADGYVVSHHRYGMELFEFLPLVHPDILILDWKPSDEIALQIIQMIRGKLSISSLPIILMSTREAEHDRVRGLESGADDYVIKPFLAGEFLARVHAVLRRSKPGADLDELRGCGVIIDREARRVTRFGRTIELGPTEYRFLELLMEHKGRLVSRTALVETVWATNEPVELRTVDAHVARLRRALVRIGETDPIATVRGSGYKFIDVN